MVSCDGQNYYLSVRFPCSCRHICHFFVATLVLRGALSADRIGQMPVRCSSRDPIQVLGSLSSARLSNLLFGTIARQSHTHLVRNTCIRSQEGGRESRPSARECREPQGFPSFVVAPPPGRSPLPGVSSRHGRLPPCPSLPDSGAGHDQPPGRFLSCCGPLFALEQETRRRSDMRAACRHLIRWHRRPSLRYEYEPRSRSGSRRSCRPRWSRYGLQ